MGKPTGFAVEAVGVVRRGAIMAAFEESAPDLAFAGGKMRRPAPQRRQQARLCGVGWALEGSVMYDPADAEVFWAVVKDCLEEIYGFSRTRASARSTRLRTTIEQASLRPSSNGQAPPRSLRNLFYHAEPIDVAGDLAGRGQTLSEGDWRKYDIIL